MEQTRQAVVLGFTAQDQVMFVHGTEAALQPPHLLRGEGGGVR